MGCLARVAAGHLRKPFFLLALFLASCLPGLPDSPTLPSGNYRVPTGVRFNLLRRDFLLHVPAGYRGDRPLPLLLVMHGAFSTGAETEVETGFSILADREGFLVAYPEGIGLFGWLQHWNAGHCCGKAAADDIDDIAFVDAVIAAVRQRLAVDPRRIYMVGMSNGGMFTYRYAAERTSVLAAAAVVGGAIGSRLEGGGEPWQVPPPALPLPIVIMHGLADEHVPAAGGKSPRKGGVRSYAPVTEAVEFWKSANGCIGNPRETMERQGALRRQQWQDCAQGSVVELDLFADWKHRWPAPHSTGTLPAEDRLRGFDASAAVWDFLRRYQRESGQDAKR
ncbi:MAG: hypothetical protein A2005_06195 [Desulfuromonadales bacterium GWC2_61_20]|nr:MAG: hypothetical protein A2005_06195 [Desulfuromonadales bacterium GWC2_61_20]